ncbi:MAG: short-chain dehydrogenase, partial [Pseudomonadota bacterium]
MSQTWIILGATSTIARCFARMVSTRGDGVLLAGRDMAELETIATDCKLRGAALAEAIAFDARNPNSFPRIIERAREIGGVISAAVFVGSMPTQDQIDADPSL